jgi:hypothetical protein
LALSVASVIPASHVVEFPPFCVSFVFLLPFGYARPSKEG